MFNRKSKAELTWKIAFQGFLSGLFGGALGQNLFIESMALTSATFATAMTNLIPAVTFILAIILRTMAGKAKLVGSVLSLAGAMILTFYKGKEVNLGSTNINLAKHEADHRITKTHALLGNNQVLGSMLGMAYCLSFSIWNIIHGPFMSMFMPCTLIFVAIVEYLFLNERLHIGSILGSVIITIGLYTVLWGKAEETKNSTQELGNY
ncbi:Drug/metabolite transporter [Corchorus olitorius]|uniref:WAT1-related protein n=1 Tax=Corchorus olitorius TaxID=93759 RepID=A0A1R3ILX7_9ROSI|nr:Drug/metabolite transporter [Corchorus olitorius]